MSIEINNLTIFYLALSLFALIGIFLTIFGKTKGEDKKTTTTTIHKVGR